jgi:schlafen family protein
MAVQDERLQRLLKDPVETLDVELKQWIDPTTPEGKAKIAKGCIALRNNNGGHFIIGFTDNGIPDKGGAPADVRKTFHTDTIQEIVGKYSSEPFAVEVSFGERDGQEYPVISVPAGVRTPVVAKAGLSDAGKTLIKDHAVYVRSLASNHTVSSSEVRRGDWERLMRVCFDNREADIGAFVRRHLAGLDFEKLATLFGGTVQVVPTFLERVGEILNIGRARFDAVVAERNIKLPALGYREAAVLVDGQVPRHTATESFLQRLFVAMPQHTGWPPWADTRRSPEEADRPYHFQGTWEAFLPYLESGGWIPPGLDFWRIDPKGTLYHLRALDDDLPHEHRKIEPRTQLDFLLQVSSVAEVISTGLSFARSMGCEEANTSLVFGFRWSGLKGRRLTSWVDPHRGVYPRGSAKDDEVLTTTVVPLETPQSSIAVFVEAVIKELFARFGGMEIDSGVIERIVTERLKASF